MGVPNEHDEPGALRRTEGRWAVCVWAAGDARQNDLRHLPGEESNLRGQAPGQALATVSAAPDGRTCRGSCGTHVPAL
jgi:hypothetical protein